MVVGVEVVRVLSVLAAGLVDSSCRYALLNITDIAGVGVTPAAAVGCPAGSEPIGRSNVALTITSTATADTTVGSAIGAFFVFVFLVGIGVTFFCISSRAQTQKKLQMMALAPEICNAARDCRSGYVRMRRACDFSAITILGLYS